VPAALCAEDQNEMKSLIVYGVGNQWFGSEVTWKRSGSGNYRETSSVELPQSRQEIERFAQESGYLIEWRRPLPDESQSQAGQISKPA
jgi:hypothetical protein